MNFNKIEHSVLREVLTLNISTIEETPIFRWIMPYACFFPTGTYHNDFFKNREIQSEKKENPENLSTFKIGKNK